MLLAAFVAFVHFLAFFVLTTTLVLQLGLLSNSISVATARRIRRADRVSGIAAILVLIFGFLRVYYFEKGADYYFDNTFFLIKVALFIAAALISIYPTVCYARWGSELKQEIAPDISTATLLRIRKIIHYELIGILGILLCASLMAKGFG
jgi:putative membrane protein